MDRSVLGKITLMLAVTTAISFSFAACGRIKAVSQDISTQEATYQNDAEEASSLPDGETYQDTAGNSTGTDSNPDISGQTSGQAAGHFKVKGLYLTGWTVSSMNKVKHFVDLANNTEINSYVIDVKDDDGYVGYESNVPAVKEAGAWKKKYDADSVLKVMHENNVHVIGRIVCFKDPVISSRRPEWAIKSTNGGLWRNRNTDGNMITWLNPYNKGAWGYLVDIAKEAVQKGFDEIQFDYVRFPNDGDKKSMFFGNTTQKKYEAIDEFLAYARKELPGVTLSADVFGIICESPADTEDIGQYLEKIGENVDYISPMVYPSHYALGQSVNGIKFPKPDLDPYNVVYNSLVKAKNRISGVSDYKAGVRPFLQDFTAPWLHKGNYQTYGAEQVEQQIKAVNDAGYDEWILWDAANTYDEGAFSGEG